MLHGGDEENLRAPGRVNPPLLRMRPFERALLRRLEDDPVTVAEVRYRHRGWNGERADAAVDARDAVTELAQRLPSERKLVLLGHSMGARAALRAGGHPAVAGVVALAAWCPAEEPVEHLAGTRLLLVHSDRDRVTPPEESLVFAARARAAGAHVARLLIAGSDHAMARHARAWQRAATVLTGALLDRWPFPDPVRRALDRTGTDDAGLELRLPLFDGGRV
ncbi:prolyl oligopeptidase family serine peptidase [Streptacidiphilus monticola]